ncbi:putative DNA binding domain-containing protein [bacterium]|nr:putative DNA binding domain-containing protein [bacterium]
MTQYSEKESRILEFKERIDALSTIFPSVVSMANDIGGRILIGVRDRDRAIVGLSSEEIDHLVERLPQAIADAIEPQLRPRIQVVNIADKSLVELQVFPGNHKPYYIASKGVEGGTYLRFGTHNKRAQGVFLRELQRESLGRYYDQERLTEATRCDLDTDKNETILLSEKAMARDAVTDTLVPTVAGMVFYGEKPSTYLPHAELLISTFADEKIDTPVKTIDLSAPLPILVDECLRIILPELSLKQEAVGATLVSTRYEVPKEALREALLNALVHRRYDIEDAIKLSLFTNRIEIMSPGNFPGPIEDYVSGISYARNPTLRQLARNAGLVEKRGFGFPLIFRSTQANGNPEPEIIEQGSSVKIILWRDGEFSQNTSPILTDRLSALSDLYRRKEPFSISQASKLMGVSSNTARHEIEALLEKEILTRKGRGRGTKYHWTSD